jgi:hypothetical protein
VCGSVEVEVEWGAYAAAAWMRRWTEVPAEVVAVELIKPGAFRRSHPWGNRLLLELEHWHSGQ